jgi:hypothetical protein
MSSNIATIAKNVILFKEIASGSISFAAGALTTTSVSADIGITREPVSKHVFFIRNNATQTTINASVYNVRDMAGTTGIASLLTVMGYTTGLVKDTLIEGCFAGHASAVRLVFTLGSAATAAEVVSADYKIFEYR